MAARYLDCNEKQLLQRNGCVTFEQAVCELEPIIDDVLNGKITRAVSHMACRATCEGKSADAQTRASTLCAIIAVTPCLARLASRLSRRIKLIRSSGPVPHGGEAHNLSQCSQCLGRNKERYACSIDMHLHFTRRTLRASSSLQARS